MPLVPDEDRTAECGDVKPRYHSRVAEDGGGIAAVLARPPTVGRPPRRARSLRTRVLTEAAR